MTEAQAKVDRLAQRYARTVGMIDELRMKATLTKVILESKDHTVIEERVAKMKRDVLTYSKSLEEIRAELEDILHGPDGL